MLSSLKKWVQDVTVDLSPPPPAPPSSSSSASLLSPFSSSSSSSVQRPTNHYASPSTSLREQQRYNERLSNNSLSSPTRLSRPISMESVPSARTSKMPTPPVPSGPPSPVELDLSHLNREEQEHIANVLKRARAVDEQPSPNVAPSVLSPPASILSASLSPSTSSTSSPISSSSSSSASSFPSEQPSKYEQNDRNDYHDDNEIRNENEEPSPAEPTFTSVRRCQVCNKELQQPGNATICSQCLDDEEIAAATQTEPTALTPPRKSASPSPTDFDNYEAETGSDRVLSIDSESMARHSPIDDYVSHLPSHDTEKANDDQGQQDDQNDVHPSSIIEHTSIPSSLPAQTRSQSLTEIDENDFFYDGPSPYVAAVDMASILESIDEPLPPPPSYRIDEYVDEDDRDERDHVKELEETIANLSRHFPSSLSNGIDIAVELNPGAKHASQPTSLSVDKIDIDSILEMEIESPSTDKYFLPSSSSMHLQHPASQHPLHLPISVPISINHRRASLSRSSGVRENLTDLLVTAAESPSDTHVLQRTASTYGKRTIPMHRQKRNLPSVPAPMHALRLRRANSESRFSLPAVPPPVLIPNSNIDDESDLLEIDLNDPMGALNSAARSKTESELGTAYERESRPTARHAGGAYPSSIELSSPNKPIKQLRDQTTNTPPLSSLNSTTKVKKKLKKKGSSSPNHTTAQHTTGTHVNGQSTPLGSSPTRSNTPSMILSLSPTSSPTTTSVHRVRLQKSTSTEMSYPFAVSKLLLIRDNLSPSRQDGTDLGFRVTGGHSIAHCMEVTACIEYIDKHHKNYNILKNAVQEGDEVLEVGGVSLRGKSGLFVKNLMNSIQNEFEIVVRSKHVIPPLLLPIEIHKPESTRSERRVKPSPVEHSPNTLSIADCNSHRRHSMDTSQLASLPLANCTLVKSRSSMMGLPMSDSSNVSDQLLSPVNHRKKSVSSKERLFSVESLHRLSSRKSIEHLIKVATTSQPSEMLKDDDVTYQSIRPDQRQSIQRNEQSSRSSLKQTSLAIGTTMEHKLINEDSSNGGSQSVPPQRRLYEHRNSLLPNDPGLNGVTGNPSIDRQNSNESDESDNLSQYFNSSQSRKGSLLPINDRTVATAMDALIERRRSVQADGDDPDTPASRRLQTFIQAPDEKRRSSGSVGIESMTFNPTPQRKLSINLGSLKFLTKKTQSVEQLAQPVEIRADDYVGDIELQIGHDSDREQLVLRIIRAKHLLAKDTNGYSDPFVKVYLLPGRDQENKRRTKHISKNLNPVWEHTAIYGHMHREELQYKMLEFTVWDYDRFKANDFLGQVTIDLKDANVIDDRPHWYRLQALRSREEASNRGSSPGLYKMTSVDSSASSNAASNRSSINTQSRVNQRKQ